MKQVRDKCQGLYKRILGGILLMLGFSACEKINDIFDDGGGVCMYGTPTANFTFKGTVTGEDGKPVTSANVIIRALGHKGNSLKSDPERFYNSPWYNDTLKVDSEGKYFLMREETSWGEEDYRIVVKDDMHESDSTEFTLKTEGGEGWFNGSAETVVDFTLKKKDGQN